MSDYEANTAVLAQAILDAPLPMDDALALFKALDDTSWRAGTDTYLEVVGTDGVSWRVVEVSSREVRTVPGSMLRARGVYTEYVLVLDPDNSEGLNLGAWYDSSTDIAGHRITRHTRATIDLYNDMISHAIIRAF